MRIRRIARADPFEPFAPLFGPRPAADAQAGEAVSRAERLFNRDLSWLRFNRRVLAEATDPSVPLLERLRFATIVSSNLDEFFMVRVAEISRAARRSPSARSPDGLTAAQTLAAIRAEVLEQKARQAAALEDVLGGLEVEGLSVHRDFELERSLDRDILKRLPPLRICRRRANEPLPPLKSGRIHVFVRFLGSYAVIELSEREGRLARLPDRKALRYALVERWLAARAPELFRHREVIEAFPFKLLREADIRYRPDDEESLESQILHAVERRHRARVVRLEVDSPSYTEGAMQLAAALGIDSAALYRFDLPLDLRTLALLCQAPPRRRLLYRRVAPQVPAPFRRRRRSVFDAIAKWDILLHHPYDSFDIVVRFLETAADDPAVTRVYHTAYRTSRDSPIMRALIRAARNGKLVTVYVEIKARFEELNNLRWAGELRRAGVRVVRPLGRFKVHSKLTQVVRLEGSREVSYLHLGTGNYHPGTARQYTDLGLLTADEGLGREVTRYFAGLKRGGLRPGRFKELLVAPGALHRRLLALVGDETRIQRAGGSGRIIAKVNALVDPELIEALYEASRAGVQIDLLVRGICCLVPGAQGMSENIRVTSVVDRFLEHSRIYYFRRGGAEALYLSSADWMPRNFYTRFELAFPVKDPALRWYIREQILGKGLADDVKAWLLRPEGTYVKREPSSKPLRSQLLFEALARKDYRDTILELR